MTRDVLVDQVTELPTVPLLLEQMRRQLDEVGYLAILSVNLLQAAGIERITGWKSFDALVRDVGRFLASVKSTVLRRDDFVSEVMISGNAFVILLAPPRISRRLEPAELARIRDRIDDRLRRFLSRRLPHEIAGGFECYIGASLVDNDAQVRPERLIYRALDQAQADSIEESRRAEERDAAGLREVIGSRLVSAVYQPIVDLQERAVVGWEALSRPAGGRFASIDRLFRAAHASRALWALERLCRERAMEGIPELAAGHQLFLNVEPDSIHDPQFRSERTLRLLERARLSPDRVVLEMTEHSAVSDFTAFRETLSYFRSMGFRLAIDDMGSGYASLVSVAEINPEFVKIDMSLVREIHRRPLKQELVRAIAGFCRRAGMAVVAEGVERIEEMAALRDAGITLAQGYLFARPAAPPPLPDLSHIR